MKRRESPSGPIELLRRLVEPPPPAAVEERVAALLFTRGLALTPNIAATPNTPAAPVTSGSIRHFAERFLLWSLLLLARRLCWHPAHDWANHLHITIDGFG